MPGAAGHGKRGVITHPTAGQVEGGEQAGGAVANVEVRHPGPGSATATPAPAPRPAFKDLPLIIGQRQRLKLGTRHQPSLLGGKEVFDSGH